MAMGRSVIGRAARASAGRTARNTSRATAGMRTSGRSSGAGTSVVPRSPSRVVPTSSGRRPQPVQAELIPRGLSGRGPRPGAIDVQGRPVGSSAGGRATLVPRGSSAPVPTGRRTETGVPRRPSQGWGFDGRRPELNPGTPPPPGRGPDWEFGDRAKGNKQRRRNERRSAMSRFGKRAAIGTGVVGTGVFMGSKRTDGPGATGRSSLYGPEGIGQMGQYY